MEGRGRVQGQTPRCLAAQAMPAALAKLAHPAALALVSTRSAAFDLQLAHLEQVPSALSLPISASSHPPTFSLFSRLSVRPPVPSFRLPSLARRDYEPSRPCRSGYEFLQMRRSVPMPIDADNISLSPPSKRLLRKPLWRRKSTSRVRVLAASTMTMSC